MTNPLRALFVFVMIAVIVIVDLLFFRHHAVARLFVNIGIVVMFASVYFTAFKKS